METDIYTVYRDGVIWKVIFEGCQNPKVYRQEVDGEWWRIPISEDHQKREDLYERKTNP